MAWLGALSAHTRDRAHKMLFLTQQDRCTNCNDRCDLSRGSATSLQTDTGHAPLMLLHPSSVEPYAPTLAEANTACSCPCAPRTCPWKPHWGNALAAFSPSSCEPDSVIRELMRWQQGRWRLPRRTQSPRWWHPQRDAHLPRRRCHRGKLQRLIQ